MSLLQQVRGPIAHIGSRNPMMRLAMYHHRIPSDTEHGLALSFRHFPFMIEPFSVLSECPDMVAQKCTQVGWTEMVMVFLVMTAGILGRRAAYIMPHDGMAKEFVQDKFGPMIDLSPRYRQMTSPRWRDKTASNVRIRQLGAGTVRFLGSRTRANLRSFSADAVVVDEVDECDQRNLSMVKDRIRNSAKPQQIRLGNPSLPGRGISRLYGMSDGRMWHHRCDSCGERQPIDWFLNVVTRNDSGSWVARDQARAKRLAAMNITVPPPMADIRPVCRRCERPFDRHGPWEWVMQRNELQRRRGHHIAQMDVPSRPLWEIFLEYLEAVGDSDAMRNFYSGVLGKAYDMSGARVTAGDLRAALRPYEQDPFGGESYAEKTVSMGVDVGAVLNVWVTVYDEVIELDEDGEPVGDTQVVRKCAWVGALRTFDELGDVLKRYHADVCVIDHGPERTKVEEFRDWAHEFTGCRVWLCSFYLPTVATKARWGIVLDEQSGSVRVSRTGLMDTAFSDLRNGVRLLPEDVFNTLDFSNQMGAPVRMLSERGDRYIWWSGHGRPKPGAPKRADHYRLADAYDLLAFHLLGMGGGYFEIDLDEDS